MRLLDDWLKHYIAFNQYNESPDEFHFWTGVGVIAAALRRKVWFPMGPYFQWTPNFYIILVAPPGIVSKSTTIGIGQSFIQDIPGIKFGSGSITWQAIIKELSEATEGVEMTDGLFHPMSCLTFFVSELGTFMNFEDGQMTDLLVDLWDGKSAPLSRDTMGHGKIEVPNAWINLMACTTPAWLSDNLPKSLIDGGFTSRCIWLFGKKKKKRVPYPQLEVVHAEIGKLQSQLHFDLEQISKLKGEFTMTADAYAAGTVWYNKHIDKLEIGDPQRSGISGYLARAQTHVHKLAMVLSASRRDTLIITEKDLTDSIALLGSVETEMPQVFDVLNTSVEQEKAGDIVSVVRSRVRVRRTELYQMFFRKMSAKEFGDAISSAVEAGLLVQEQKGSFLWIAVPGALAT